MTLQKTDWAKGTDALRTPTDSTKWNYGWSTPNNNPSGVGEAPNLNQQNYWMNASHKWFEYLETEMRTQQQIIAERSVAEFDLRTLPASIGGQSICWSPELSLFCAVGAVGTGSRVSTSSDGINWTTRTSAADNFWSSVCWSPELSLFCAVAASGTGNRVMTSPDGITWTIRTSAADNAWRSVCWSPELSLFCALASSGTNNRIMTSPDGVTWTIRNSGTDIYWEDICWSPDLGIFCATGRISGGVNISSDGINWRFIPLSIGGRGICWSPELGIFCITAESYKVAISSDGVNWVEGSTGTQGVYKVAWSPVLGLFCATGGASSGTRISTSYDGFTWTSRKGDPTQGWNGVCWSSERGMFCAIAYNAYALTSL